MRAMMILGLLLSVIVPAHAGTVTFSYTPDRAILTTPYQPGMYFDGPLVTFSGTLLGVEEGDNFSFDLKAKVSSAAYDGQLGDGYLLSQLIGTSPAITVTNGMVTFANAAFRRSETEAFQLSTPTGDYLTGSQYTDSEGGSHLDFINDNSSLVFGSLQAGSVPEPSTWMMMIGGMAACGAMLRRNRALTARRLDDTDATALPALVTS